MKKIIALLISALMILSVMPAVSAAPAEVDIFVSPSGDDSYPGTIDQPLKTPAKAWENAKSYITSGYAVTVYFRGGEYNFTETLEIDGSSLQSSFNNDIYKFFDRENSITFKAYNNEEVTFTGAHKISADKITPVTEEDEDIYGNRILDRVIDDYAKTKLMKIDLSSYPYDLPEIPDRGYDRNHTPYAEVYVNNEALGESRWPNNEEYSAMLETQAGTSGKTAVYPDAENRTKLWNKKAVEKDLYMSGFFNSYWYGNIYKVGDFDANSKTATAKGDIYGNNSFQPGFPMYFYNLLEEIDMPGESYIDRENKIAYFYPSTEIDENAEVYVSALEKNILSIQYMSKFTIEGIDFKYTVGTPIKLNTCIDFEINDCVIAHTSNLGIEITKGSNTITQKNITVQNCHIYDTAYGGIKVSKSGDRHDLTSANILITNNILHDNDRCSNNYAPAIQIAGNRKDLTEYYDPGVVGVDITHNLLYNNKHQMIELTNGCNDITMEYNEIHHALTEAGDMGAIYYGRNPSTLGIKINYNYFHQIGNPYNIWTQSIFGDDGNMGAEIIGNVFYQGTLTTENGGTQNERYPIKTNGGQYYNVQNNVFIDSPTAAHFQEWVGKGFSSPYQSEYITYNYDIELDNNSITSTYGKYKQWVRIEDWISNETWINNYTDTQWEPFFKDFSLERFNQLQEYAESNNASAAKTYIRTFVPSVTNTFKNNVLVKIDNQNLIEGRNNTKTSDNYYSYNGTDIFEDYENGDFSIKSDKLSEIQSVAKDFKDIPFDEMGLTSDVDGSVPSASNAYIVKENGAYTIKYDFEDPDGDKEGHSKYVWYISDTADGEYERLYGVGGKDYEFDKSLNGKYIKAEITPVDYRTRYGETIETQPVQLSLRQTLSFDANGGEGQISSKTLWDNEEYKLPSAAPQKDGYDFLGWSDSQDGEAMYQPKDTISITENTVLYAVWEETPSVSVSMADNEAVITSSAQLENACVVIAEYSGLILKSAKLINIDIAQGETKIPYVPTSGNSLKIMVLRTKQGLRPLCSVYSN